MTTNKSACDTSSPTPGCSFSKVEAGNNCEGRASQRALAREAAHRRRHANTVNTHLPVPKSTLCRPTCLTALCRSPRHCSERVFQATRAGRDSLPHTPCCTKSTSLTSRVLTFEFGPLSSCSLLDPLPQHDKSKPVKVGELFAVLLVLGVDLKARTQLVVCCGYREGGCEACWHGWGVAKSNQMRRERERRRAKTRQANAS